MPSTTREPRPSRGSEWDRGMASSERTSTASAVLFSALTTFFGMWGLNGMPRLHHPLFTSERFLRVTADRFFIAIEASDPKFDTRSARELADSLGGTAVEEVYE